MLRGGGLDGRRPAPHNQIIMNLIRKKVWVIPLAFTLLAWAAPAQEKPSPDSHAAQAAPKELAPSKAEKRPSLADVTRVSTSEAAKNAPRHPGKNDETKKPSEKPGEGEVLELQPITPARSAACEATSSDSKSAKKSPLKDIHGKAYGSLNLDGARSRRTGGAVGAKSKNSKTDVYIETDRANTSSPHR